MDKCRSKIEIAFNEKELICLKAALFRYAKDAPGRYAKTRALRLAEMIKGYTLAFDSETYLDADIEGNLTPPGRSSRTQFDIDVESDADPSQYEAMIRALCR